jgi:branched-chain amino acid transport system permease protein
MSSAAQFYLTNIAVFFGVDLIAVWGLNLQFGVTGIVNFAFIVLQAAGAYTAALLTLGPSSANGGFQHYLGGTSLPFPLPIIAAGLVGAVLSALLALLTRRRLRGDYAAMVLLVVSLMATTIVQNQTGFLNGSAGLSLVPAPLQSLMNLTLVGYAWFYVGLTALFCLGALAVVLAIGRSPLGRAMRASRDNEESAAAVGLNVSRLRMTAYVVGGALAGVSGALLVGYIGTWAPGAWLYPETFVYFAAVIVGGRGNVLGVAIGSLLVNIAIVEVTRYLPQFGPAGFVDALQWVVIGLLIMAFLWLRPRGIVPERPPVHDLAPARLGGGKRGRNGG